MVCGVCFCDLNRDGLLGLVLGQHFVTPWRETVPNRLLNLVNAASRTGCRCSRM
jgi:hypothetical protein